MVTWDVSTQTEWEDATDTHSDTRIESDQLKLAGDYALDFDGTDDYVETTTLGDYGSTEMEKSSTSFWIKTTSTEKTEIFNASSEDNQILRLRINQDGYWNEDKGKIFVQLKDEDGSRLWGATDDDLGFYDGDWHHIYVEWDCVDDNDITILVDDDEKSFNYRSRSTLDNLQDFDEDFSFGVSEYDGELDDFRIYDGQRTSEEISDLASDRYHNVATSDLRAWWKMNEGSGSTVYDSSGNNNDGTIEGATWCGSGTYLDTGLWTSDIWDDGFTGESTFKSFSTSVATLPSGSSADVKLIVYDDDGSTILDESAWYSLSEGSNNINFYVDNGNYWQLKYDLRADDTNSTPEIDSYSLESVRLPLTGNVKLSGSNVEGANIYCIKKSSSEYEDSDTTDSNGDYEVLVSEDDTVYVVSVVYYDSSEDKYYGMSKTIDYSS